MPHPQRDIIKAATGLRSRFEAAIKSAFSEEATTCVQNQSEASDSFAIGSRQSPILSSDRAAMRGDAVI